MKDREFREVLKKAVRGDKVAMEQIFILYKPDDRPRQRGKREAG